MAELDQMHKLLSRQLKKSTYPGGEIDTSSLYRLITEAYEESDKRYSLLNKSMELMSEEMLDLNMELREQAIATEAIIHSVNDGIFSLDHTGNIYLSNSAGQKLFKYNKTEMTHMSLGAILPEFDFIALKKSSTFNCEGGQGEASFCSETVGLKKDGSLFQAEIYIAPINVPNQELYVCNVRDITAQKENERNLYSAAYYDKLTKLPNRALFLERLQEIVERNKRGEDCKSALLFIDLDRFKMINDSLGHEAGDELLRQVSARLKKLARKYDTVSRLGGDEFTILIGSIENEEAVREAAHRFLDAFKVPFKILEREFSASASIGIYIIKQTDTISEEILRNSDLAMYKAKKNGRGCCEIFHEDHLEEMLSLLKVESGLKKGIEKKEMVVFYQPIIELETGKISGFESLVRWNHPEHGLIYPDHFIPVAEETGLIRPLGHYVLEESCQRIKDFQKLALPGEQFFITINLSPHQLVDSEEIKHIIKTIKSAKLAPGVLKLECTETAFMKENALIKKFFNDAKEIGVDLCIDDFGTGYSALEYIHRFPFDILKIDRTFITSMKSSEKDLNLVTGIVSLAHNLGLDVVAEGVEEKLDVDHLLKMKVAYVQGYYFAKPASFEEMCSFIKERGYETLHQIPPLPTAQDLLEKTKAS